MIYLLSKQAKKYLKSLQPRITGKLIEAIEKLPEGKVKPIKGKKTPPLFRLRVGKYRIIFLKSDHQIRIVKIDTRGDVYKNL
ncbi:MAG: type II toxin-antitoxin system RelE/ParE family toxin [Candidatus Marinimicrobia bacterium]|nr:type II toxin-antitoxin system RelE/ParE family toxin [Candidatus Neomarinimicrobiota bacterium]